MCSPSMAISSSVSMQSADTLLADIRKRGLTVDWILDTHPHADHLTALAYLKDKLGSPSALAGCSG